MEEIVCYDNDVCWSKSLGRILFAQCSNSSCVSNKCAVNVMPMHEGNVAEPRYREKLSQLHTKERMQATCHRYSSKANTHYKGSTKGLNKEGLQFVYKCKMCLKQAKVRAIVWKHHCTAAPQETAKEAAPRVVDAAEKSDAKPPMTRKERKRRQARANAIQEEQGDAHGLPHRLPADIMLVVVEFLEPHFLFLLEQSSLFLKALFVRHHDEVWGNAAREVERARHAFVQDVSHVPWVSSAYTAKHVELKPQQCKDKRDFVATHLRYIAVRYELDKMDVVESERVIRERMVRLELTKRGGLTACFASLVDNAQEEEDEDEENGYS